MEPEGSLPYSQMPANSDTNEGDQYVGWRFEVVFLCSSTLAEEGTPVPKHVAVLYSCRIMLTLLHCIAFYSVHSLADITKGIQFFRW
jgi:hypothetical protein